MIIITKKCNYNEKTIYEKMPFRIKDLLFSGILYMAKYLLKIIDILEEDEGRGSAADVQNLKFSSKDEISKYGKYEKEILQWISRTKRNFYRYFLPHYYSKIGKNELGLFLDYDLIAKDWIKSK
jgi:hypothetical protein